MSVIQYGCTLWPLKKCWGKSKLRKTQGCCVLFWTNSGSSTLQKKQLYSHLPAISQTIQVRPAGHCWWSNNIIIMSCRQHGYPWPSLATSPYYSSPLVGLQGYILCPHIAAVCRFELVVLLLLGHMWGSIGVHRLWARPCFSSSVLYCIVFVMGGKRPYIWCLVGCCRQDLFTIALNILV